MATTASAPWTCPTCGTSVSSLYCPECGERMLLRRDLSFRAMLLRMFNATTNVDGRMVRSFLTLVRRPGSMAAAWVAGMRKPYLPPFQVFVLANVLFFAVQSVSESQVFGTHLASHLHEQDWSPMAREWIATRLQGTHETLAHYAPRFDRAVERNAKSLVILMTVPFALLLALLFRRADRPFVLHASLALHFFAVVLIVFSASLLIADLDLRAGGPGLHSARFDNLLTAINIVACMAWLYVAVGQAYDARGAPRWWRTLVLVLALGPIVLGFRFAMFVLSVWMTT